MLLQSALSTSTTRLGRTTKRFASRETVTAVQATVICKWVQSQGVASIETGA
jgi:hypothetical protein